MTTAIYARVSTQNQGNKRQIEECKNQLEEDEEYEIYADIGTGMNQDREDYQRMIQDIKKGKIDKVVTWELSRIGRKLADVADFIDFCTDHQIRVETVNDMFPGVRPGNDIFEKMINQFMAWMIEFERQMIRERVQSGVNKAIKEGKHVGRPPYGFTTNEEGYLVLEPEDYLAMQTAVEKALTEPDKSVNSIAQASGVPQSSLQRITKDEEKRKLYLMGEYQDERVEKAVEKADIKPEAEISKLQQRIQELEKKIDNGC